MIVDVGVELASDFVSELILVCNLPEVVVSCSAVAVADSMLNSYECQDFFRRIADILVCKDWRNT